MNLVGLKAVANKNLKFVIQPNLFTSLFLSPTASLFVNVLLNKLHLICCSVGFVKRNSKSLEEKQWNREKRREKLWENA